MDTVKLMAVKAKKIISKKLIVTCIDLVAMLAPSSVQIGKPPFSRRVPIP